MYPLLPAQPNINPLRYGFPFLQHTYLHHITRIDHRHNFSPYNTLLYLSSTPEPPGSFRLESLAFFPQLFLSAIALPFLLAKKDLPSTMLAQTFAFVSFNKVCTSQVISLSPFQASSKQIRKRINRTKYFLWYFVFLPFYLPTSSLLLRPYLGLSALALWIGTQGLWLQQGFNLEFLGISTFVPGLWAASLTFFAVNVWILGIIVGDVGAKERRVVKSPSDVKRLKS